MCTGAIVTLFLCGIALGFCLHGLLRSVIDHRYGGYGPEDVLHPRCKVT